MKNMRLILELTEPSAWDNTDLSSRRVEANDFPLLTKRDHTKVLENYINICSDVSNVSIVEVYNRLPEALANMLITKRKAM